MAIYERGIHYNIFPKYDIKAANYENTNLVNSLTEFLPFDIYMYISTSPTHDQAGDGH